MSSSDRRAPPSRRPSCGACGRPTRPRPRPQRSRRPRPRPRSRVPRRLRLRQQPQPRRSPSRLPWSLCPPYPSHPQRRTLRLTWLWPPQPPRPRHPALLVRAPWHRPHLVARALVTTRSQTRAPTCRRVRPPPPPLPPRQWPHPALFLVPRLVRALHVRATTRSPTEVSSVPRRGASLARLAR